MGFANASLADPPERRLPPAFCDPGARSRLRQLTLLLQNDRLEERGLMQSEYEWFINQLSSGSKPALRYFASLCRDQSAAWHELLLTINKNFSCSALSSLLKHSSEFQFFRRLSPQEFHRDPNQLLGVGCSSSVYSTQWRGASVAVKHLQPDLSQFASFRAEA